VPICTTQLRTEGCRFDIERRGPAALLVRIEGHDVGEFGALPMRCIEALLPPERPVELFVDARATRGASMDVSNDWAAWLGRERKRFARIHMLTGSRYVQFTAEFVRRFSELDAVMQLYREAPEFDRALGAHDTRVGG
jgi:hypothetical protein